MPPILANPMAAERRVIPGCGTYRTVMVVRSRKMNGDNREQSGPDAIRLVVAADQALFRHGLSLVLDQEQDVDVVAEAGSGDEAVRMALIYEPQVVAMDVWMVPTPGVDAARIIKRALPSTSIVMLVDDDEEVEVLEEVATVADATLIRGGETAAVARRIREVALRR